MPIAPYNWKRFWSPREQAAEMDLAGYLLDPQPQMAGRANSHLKMLDALQEFPCLILLGEPGMGKTTTLSQAREAIDNAIQGREGSVLWFDLHSYGDENRLYRNLFESDALLAWKRGSGELHLFLDSFDECLLRIDTIATLLVDEFKRLPVDRLRLRIACRGAAWPSSFENGISKLWDKDRLAVYELEPLRRDDVLEAADAEGLPNPEEFVGAVEQKQAVPLAIKPITLQFLLNTYQRNGSLPPRQADLYREGCQLLANEVNQERRDAGLRGALSPAERLAVAGRIAVASVYGGRSAVWTGIDRGDVPVEDAKVANLAGASVMVNGNALPVSEASVRDALSCALFKSTEPERVWWAHRSYAEYLAAWHLVEQKVPITQITSLLYHDADGRVVPQLYGAAGWLAVLQRDVFDCIVRTDPDLILSADLAGLDEGLRASIAQGFLAAIESEAVPFDFGWHWHFNKLAHPGLADQIRPYLIDRGKPARARHEAIAIAKACEVKGVQAELAELALDDSEQIDLRANAACGVASLADADVRALLRPLAAGVQSDTADELKGCALRALWPAQMTAVELFKLLTPPKRGGAFIGSYSSFLSRQLTDSLTTQDVPAALKWLEQSLADTRIGIPLERIAARVFHLGWTNLDDPGLLQLLARGLSLWLERAPYLGIRLEEAFVRALYEDDTKRRRLVEAMIPGLTDASQALMALEFRSPRLLFGRDVPWMCERLASANDRARTIWAKLLSRLVDPTDVDNLGRIIAACSTSPALESELHYLVAPVELGSAQARALQEEYREEQQRLQVSEEQRRVPPAQERIDACLDRFDSGQLDAWWHANYEMVWEADGTAPLHESEPDLTALPGWKDICAETQARLLRAATVYLRDADPRTREWLGTDTMHRPAWAGYRALRLILSQQPQSLDELSAAVWRKWAAIALAYPIYGEAERSAQIELLKRANAHAANELIESLLALTDKENRENRGFFPSLDAMGECWSDSLKNVLLDKLKDSTLTPQCAGRILRLLLEHDVRQALEFCRALVVLPVPAGGPERERTLVAAISLLAHARDASWSDVWPVIRDDNAFGREVTERLMRAFDVGAGGMVQKLTESQLADFYAWLVHQYPYSDDPVHDGRAYAVGPRDQVCHFRESVRENLKSRGTHESSTAFERLIGEFPDLHWLNQVLLEAQRITRERTWVPPAVSEIVRVTTDANVRLVGSSSQLLDVLIESLERLQDKFLGETPRSRFLWNEVAEKKWRPKEEESLSDYIKAHFEDDLKDRGIVLAREVQIRRLAGNLPGEVTDIYATAVRKNASGQVYDSTSAVIEVKGSWNPKLKTAMQLQLVERYLKDNGCAHGLYVVGWFNCESWDKSDSRQEHAPKWSLDEAKRRFEEQASELSSSDLLIRAFVIDVALR
jgi:hypothetical protein